jgi:hypothetical protein
LIDFKLTKKESIAPIKDFLESANISFPFTIEMAFRKDSRLITQEDRENLVEIINTFPSAGSLPSSFFTRPLRPLNPHYALRVGHIV